MNNASFAQDQLLLTLNQAAQRLAICRRTLERLIAGKKFPRPLKLEGATRVPVSDVENYVADLLKQRAS